MVEFKNSHIDLFTHGDTSFTIARQKSAIQILKVDIDIKV